MMVAEGSVDICAEPELSLWDMAANAIIVQEAGGRFTGLDGVPGPAQRQRGGVERAAPRRAAGLSEPALLTRRYGARAPSGERAIPRAPRDRTRPLLESRKACEHESPPTCELVNPFVDADAIHQGGGSMPMLVRDAMSTVVLTIGPAHTLRQAAQLMSARRVGAAVVLDPDTSGTRHPHRARHPQLARRRARTPTRDRPRPHHHRRRLRRPGWTLEEAADAMAHGGFRHLIVLDDQRARRHRLGPRHHPLLGARTASACTPVELVRLTPPQHAQAGGPAPSATRVPAHRRVRPVRAAYSAAQGLDRGLQPLAEVAVRLAEVVDRALGDVVAGDLGDEARRGCRSGAPSRPRTSAGRGSRPGRSRRPRRARGLVRAGAAGDGGRLPTAAGRSGPGRRSCWARSSSRPCAGRRTGSRPGRWCAPRWRAGGSPAGGRR